MKLDSQPLQPQFCSMLSGREEEGEQPARGPPSVCGERERKAMKGDGGRVGENERRKEKAAMRCKASYPISSGRGGDREITIILVGPPGRER